MPPLLIGVGILIPALIKGSPFKIPTALRSLAGIIACILCWAAYFIVVGMGERWTFDPWMTIAPVLASTAILIGMLAYVWNRRDALSKNWPFLTYLFSIFFLALASGNWIGQSGISIVTFRSSDPLRSVDIQLNGAEVPVRLFTDSEGNLHEWSWVVQTEDRLPRDIKFVYVNGDQFNGSKILPVHTGFPAKRFEFVIASQPTSTPQ